MCDLRRLDPTRMRDLGCHTPAALRHAIATGVLVRPFRGVVVGCEVAREPVVLVRAAQLSVGGEFPGSFDSAAAALGFGVVDDGRTHLTGAEPEVDRDQHGLRVHSTHLRPTTCRIGGVLLTAPDRTAIDLARLQHPRDQLVVLDAALRTGRVTSESLAREVEAQAGLRGIVTVRHTVDLADGRAESPQESRLRWIALVAGLPPPELQLEVDAGQVRYRLDMGYRHRRLGIEYDGELHAERLGWDRARHNALDALGWRMLYFTKQDLRQEQATADRLAEALGMRAKAVPLSRRPRWAA